MSINAFSYHARQHVWSFIVMLHNCNDICRWMYLLVIRLILKIKTESWQRFVTIKQADNIEHRTCRMRVHLIVRCGLEKLTCWRKRRVRSNVHARTRTQRPRFPKIKSVTCNLPVSFDFLPLKG